MFSPHLLFISKYKPGKRHMDPVRESSVFFSSFCPSQVSPLQGRMAPELLLGGCSWPQSSGQRQAAKALAALRFQSVLPQGMLCRGQSQASWVSVVCVDGAHESPHLSWEGRGPHPAFYPDCLLCLASLCRWGLLLPMAATLACHCHCLPWLL